MFNIAILGFGTVGSGVYEVIKENNALLKEKTGEDIGAIDYKTLQDIAVSTHGEFYRAQSQAELSKIYQDIDKLEKTKMKVKSYDHLHEAYMPFAWFALIFFCFELLLRWTVFRRLP